MSRQFLLYQKYPATPVVVEAKTFKENRKKKQILYGCHSFKLPFKELLFEE
jgi:hypothetical protein